MSSKYYQTSLFDDVNQVKYDIKSSNNDIFKQSIDFSEIEYLCAYNLDSYIKDVEENGLKKTWDNICKFILCNKAFNKFLDVSNFGELYEIGLAIQDKKLKKKNGQYYTPDDVAMVMSEWLDSCEGDVVCDVGCGTGKLILTYLNFIGESRAKSLIESGNLYLYDFDSVALQICKTAIITKYQITNPDLVHNIYCDFLGREICLPKNAKVISNPPYAGIEKIESYWNHSDVLLDTKELYSAFMEKIFMQAKSTVIITPFSFISGNKFYSLRKMMCNVGSGFIVSFDNVPGNIFCGRKHGIFNTNTANSVRAAITVLKQGTKKGFRISPLIRFKNEERERLLKTNVLEQTLPNNYQIIDKKNKTFSKVFVELNKLYEEWVTKSSNKLSDYLQKIETQYLIDMPNTCRYYTTASSQKLKRNGSITMYFANEDIYNFMYCLINSSFAYWWWRIFDGGITFPVSLVNSMPIPYNLLSDADKEFFSNVCKEMKNKENDYIVTKVNAGAIQENIKFPEKYRNQINQRVINILGLDIDERLFSIVHANKFFEE